MANLGDVRTRVQTAIFFIKDGKSKDALTMLRKAEEFLDVMIGDKEEEHKDKYTIDDLGNNWY